MGFRGLQTLSANRTWWQWLREENPRKRDSCPHGSVSEEFLLSSVLLVLRFVWCSGTSITTWSSDQKVKGNSHWEDLVQFMLVWLTSKTVLCKSKRAKETEMKVFRQSIHSTYKKVGRSLQRDLIPSSNILRIYSLMTL